jgi:hypothetical protein
MLLRSKGKREGRKEVQCLYRKIQKRSIWPAELLFISLFHAMT